MRQTPSRMVKFRIPPAIQEFCQTTFYLGLMLIVLGVVPIFLILGSRSNLDDIFYVGVALVAGGVCLSAVSSSLIALNRRQGGGAQESDRVWSTDLPPSYEEALAMPRPCLYAPTTDRDVEVVISVPALLVSTPGVNCIRLPDYEHKSSVC